MIELKAFFLYAANTIFLISFVWCEQKILLSCQRFSSWRALCRHHLKADFGDREKFIFYTEQHIQEMRNWIISETMNSLVCDAQLGIFFWSTMCVCHHHFFFEMMINEIPWQMFSILNDSRRERVRAREMIPVDWSWYWVFCLVKSI